MIGIEGKVVFKVSLGKAYRKLAIPSTINLDELACSILSAFNFNNDHLYEFIFKNNYGITERISHSYADIQPKQFMKLWRMKLLKYLFNNIR